MNIDKLDEIVVKCNNTCNRTIKMRPVDFKLCAYIEYGVEHNDEDLKFEIGDHLNISKCKNIFTRGCTPNWSEEVYVIKKVKKKPLYHGNTSLVISTMKKNVGKFYEKEFRIE